MIQHPYLLLLLLLFPVYFYFKNRVKFYFRHACLQNLQGFADKTWLKWQHFMLCGVFFITLAACNITWKMMETSKVYQVHKYVLVNDGSGSMISFQKENGIGDQLAAVLSGNDKLFEFLGKRKDGSKDLVGAIVFSDDAFVVAGLTDDPQFVQKKLKRIDYRLDPMAKGTDIESGLWAGVEMLLSHNDVLDQDELYKLQFKFYGQENKVKIDDFIKSVVERKDKFSGGSIIIFTDGVFNAIGSQRKMSSFKIIDFCKLVGIRVYFISVFDLDKDLIKFCKDTGGRGEVIKEFDQKKLEEIYNEIVVSQANEYVVKELSVDHSLSDILGGVALWLILTGFMIHTTLQLNFTEV
jgi:hypothetical protein